MRKSSKTIFNANNRGKKKTEKQSVVLTQAELERKAVEGAKKALKDYRRVFERLAEYDRA